MFRVCSNCHEIGHDVSACKIWPGCFGDQYCGRSDLHKSNKYQWIGGFSKLDVLSEGAVSNLREVKSVASINTNPTNGFSIKDAYAVNLFYETIRDLNPERNAAEVISVILRCAVKFLIDKYNIKLFVEKEEYMKLTLGAERYIQGPVDFVVHLHEGCREDDDKTVLIVEVKTEATFSNDSSIKQLQCEVIAGWETNLKNQSKLFYDFHDLSGDEEEGGGGEDAEKSNRQYMALDQAECDDTCTELQPVRGVLVSLTKMKTIHCDAKEIAMCDKDIDLPTDHIRKSAMMFDIFVRSIVAYVRPYLESYLGAEEKVWNDEHNPN